MSLSRHTHETMNEVNTQQESPHIAPSIKSDLKSQHIDDVQVDRHGFPLQPQPSHFQDDPLNWSSRLKWSVLLQVSFLAFLGPFNSAVINPAYAPLAQYYHISSQTASYATTTTVLLQGIFPLAWTPLANVYGRRPVFLLTSLIGVAATIGTAASPTWAGLLAARAVSGAATSAAMAVGIATVNDLFFTHEKGTKMGIWTLFFVNGSHVAPIIGGYLAQTAGFRWCWYLPAIVNGALLVVMLFALPETLFARSEARLARHKVRTYQQLLWDFRGNALQDRQVHVRDLIRPFEMLKYPSVALVLPYFFVSFGYAAILQSVTVAILFRQEYAFSTGVIGLMLGVPALIGSLCGELLAGPFSDLIVRRYARRNDGIQKPEARLPAYLPSAIITPAGIIIYGACLHFHTHWIGPVIGNAIAGFGLQLTLTISYAYCSDCYKPQSGEIGSLFNFGRQVFSFTIGFYAIPFANEINVLYAWLTLAMIVLLTFVGPFVLIFKGEQWRQKLGQPQFHRDI